MLSIQPSLFVQIRTAWSGPVIAMLLVTGSLVSTAQRSNPPPIALTPEVQHSALASIKAQLDTNYYSIQLLPDIMERLGQGETNGRYATSDPVQFAALVTEDMQAITKDTHLHLSFHPDWYRSTTQPTDPQEAEVQNRYWEQVARATNFGITETRVLTGNVRYLKIEGFSWIEGEGVRAYDSAMNFLKGGRAIIVDLRSNRGGETTPAYYFLSHFLGPDELMYTWFAPGKPDFQLRASPYLPNGRLTDKPLYILVNGRSRSAAEAIAYAVRQFNLGEVVGERTEGAANPSDDFAVAPCFRLSIPVRYPEDPVAHSNWEGVGVTPTIPTTSNSALDIAYGMAIDTLLASDPTTEEQLFLEWAKDRQAAKAKPFNPSTVELSDLTGNYGTLQIELRDHSLWLLRADGAPLEIEPIGGPGLFEATEDFMVRVRLQNEELVLLQIGSTPVKFKRTTKP